MSETNEPIDTNLESIEEEIIPIETAGHLVPVARSQVQWVEAAGDYVRLHTSDRSHLWRMSLSRLTEQWAGLGFVLIHRSCLVLLPLVTDVWMGPCGCNVRIGSGPNAVDLPVSRRQAREVKQRWIQQHRTNGNSTYRAA